MSWKKSLKCIKNPCMYPVVDWTSPYCVHEVDAMTNEPSSQRPFLHMSSPLVVNFGSWGTLTPRGEHSTLCLHLEVSALTCLEELWAFNPIREITNNLPSGIASRIFSNRSVWTNLYPIRRHCRGCQIFLGAAFQNEKKYTKWPQTIPNIRKIYQMAL
jgi:hypothetical protein